MWCQVYSVELLGVIGQACKRQLNIIHNALAAAEQQRQAKAQPLPSQAAPCLMNPLCSTRALFILLQNPMNGEPLSSQSVITMVMGPQDAQCLC